MSTSAPDPAAAAPAMPTVADAQAIFQQAADAARAATEAAGQAEAARAAAASEASKRFEGMPKATVDQIAAAASQQVVAMLREEFELKGAAADPTAPPAIPDGGVSGGTAPGALAAPAADALPERTSIARRILGY